MLRQRPDARYSEPLVWLLEGAKVWDSRTSGYRRGTSGCPAQCLSDNLQLAHRCHFDPVCLSGVRARHMFLFTTCMQGKENEHLVRVEPMKTPIVVIDGLVELGRARHLV